MRLKDIVLVGLLSLVSIPFASCGHDQPVIDNSWNSGTLAVTKEVVFEGSNTQSINIKATTKPSLESDAAWLKTGEVKKLTTGIYTVELNAEANVTGETRIAKVTVTAGKETAVVTVTQIPSDVMEIISVDPQGTLDPDGGTLTISYRATGKPVTNLPEWIKLADTRSLDDGVLSFVYSANNTGKERVGIIVFAVGKGAVANLTVTQAPGTSKQ
ncbi:MAG: hypothetical protein K2N09_08860 [Muribaculaceae bacterium]|nr:hypothetical protein [Muribaculaceae bacterium]